MKQVRVYIVIALLVLLAFPMPALADEGADPAEPPLAVGKTDSAGSAEPAGPDDADAPMPAPLEDGLYTIAPASTGSLRAATAAASLKNGANVRLETARSYQLEQMWQLTWKGDGYEIMNANSGNVLDAVGATQNPLASVKQAKRSSAPTQRWIIEQAAGGTFQLSCAATGTRLAAAKNTPKAGCDLALSAADSSKPDAFKLRRANALPTGTVRLFSKLKRTTLCASMPDLSTASGTQARLAKAANRLGERLVIARDGDAFTLQVACSGKYLTASGGRVVQRAKGSSLAQRWRAGVANTGGVQIVNVATGKALAVRGPSKKAGAKLIDAKLSNASAQRWFPRKAQLLPTGLYEMRPRNANSLRLDVAGGSLQANANAFLYKRNGCNSQKFAITKARSGYYRIGMAYSNTVLGVAGASKAACANVRLEKRSGAASQLWKPTVTDNGIVFVNKKSGRALAPASASAGSNVRQGRRTPFEKSACWALGETSANQTDRASFLRAISAAPGGGLKVGNAISGYKVSNARWNQLVRALDGCWSRGVSLGFVMLDCSTGMTISCNPDGVKFGASTVKSLYVTYLFEEYLEKGRLSWNDIGSLAWPTIVYSNNDCYRALRARFGTESGFARWLGEAGVGYIGTWGDYSARTLAKAWTRMAAYASSDGNCVGTWKWLFRKSDHSFIREALSATRNVYSKPGWMEAGTWSGTIMNDAAVVDDRHGRSYVLAFMTTTNPDAHRWAIGRVASALDAIHDEMPSHR